MWIPWCFSRTWAITRARSPQKFGRLKCSLQSPLTIQKYWRRKNTIDNRWQGKSCTRNQLNRFYYFFFPLPKEQHGRWRTETVRQVESIDELKKKRIQDALLVNHQINGVLFTFFQVNRVPGPMKGNCIKQTKPPVGFSAAAWECLPEFCCGAKRKTKINYLAAGETRIKKTFPMTIIEMSDLEGLSCEGGLGFLKKLGNLKLYLRF